MSCLITALTRSDNKRITKKKTNKITKTKKFTSKTQYLNKKAPSENCQIAIR